MGLSVVLQRLSIKEMQNSIDFVAAKVPRLRSMTILTPFPEQNVTKFTQQQQMVSDAICEDQREVDFQVVLILLLKILQFLSKQGCGRIVQIHLINNFYVLLGNNVRYPPNTVVVKDFRSSCGVGGDNNVETNYNSYIKTIYFTCLYLVTKMFMKIC